MMDYLTGNYVYESLKSTILDTRFQVAIVLALLVHWAWRLPRPRKGAGNRSIFITGCDSGMGHRMARRFDEMGLHVFAGCLNAEGKGAKSLKEACSNRLHIVPIDISKEDQIKEAVAYVKANLPPYEKGLYGLINNAGVMSYMPMELMTTNMVDNVIQINLMGTISVTKHFLPLIKQAEGRIITITSILARLPLAQTAVYTATKHALNGFFCCLRCELQDQGIHVAMIEPGDFSRTTDIMQWTHNNLDKMWKTLNQSEQEEKLHLYEAVKRQIQVTKASPAEQEENYKYLLNDVEDAMLAEEPYGRYVSAPLSARLKLWIARNLPEEMTFKLMTRKMLQKK